MSQKGTGIPASRQVSNEPKEGSANDRQKRLETALRENLFRRKQQARARKQPDSSKSDQQ